VHLESPHQGISHFHLPARTRQEAVARRGFWTKVRTLNVHIGGALKVEASTSKAGHGEGVAEHLSDVRYESL
jgi:hypothetical protein